MKTAKRNRFWQLHLLLGIALGLPLFVIFVAGTLAFFEPQSIHWTQPHFGELPDEPPALDGTIAGLLEKHPGSEELAVVLASPDRAVTDVFLEANHEHFHYWVDPVTLAVSEATPHEADLFHFFIDLHYFEFIPFGREITGLIAALFFAVILTGIVYQWRSIRKDAHPRNLSLERKSRWKNIHRFTSLFTLPYQAAYSVTGASLALGLFLAAPAIYLFFDGKPEELNRALFPAEMATAEPPADVPVFRVDEALAVAREQWPDDVAARWLQVAEIEATEDMPASRTIRIYGKEEGVHFVGSHVLVLDGELGVLHDQSPTSHLAPMMIEAIVNLHFGTFSSLAIKALFAAVGLIVSLSIAAGVLILLRRKQQGASKNSRGTRLLAVLTDWLLGGFPLAIALSLHAVQWAPSAPLVVFAVVAVATLLARCFDRRGLPRHALLTAAALLLLPLSFTLVHHQSPLQWGSPHEWIVTSFHVFFVFAAAGIFWLTRKLRVVPG